MATNTSVTKPAGEPAKKQPAQAGPTAARRSTKSAPAPKAAKAAAPAGKTAHAAAKAAPAAGRKAPAAHKAAPAAEKAVPAEAALAKAHAPRKADAPGKVVKAGSAKHESRAAKATAPPVVTKAPPNKPEAGAAKAHRSEKAVPSKAEKAPPAQPEAGTEEKVPGTEKVAKAPAKSARATHTGHEAPPPNQTEPAQAHDRSTHTSEKSSSPKSGLGLLSSRKRDTPARRTEGYTEERFLSNQRHALDTERATYTEQARSLREEAESLVEEMEPGDIQFDDESGEGGTVTVDRERDLALSAQALVAVDEIDHAITKMAHSTYGICENCGRLIPKPRLEALPFARLCIDCKSGGLSRR